MTDTALRALGRALKALYQHLPSGCTLELPAPWLIALSSQFASYRRFTPEKLVDLLTTLQALGLTTDVEFGWSHARELRLGFLMRLDPERRLQLSHALVACGADFWYEADLQTFHLIWRLKDLDDLGEPGQIPNC